MFRVVQYVLTRSFYTRTYLAYIKKFDVSTSKRLEKCRAPPIPSGFLKTFFTSGLAPLYSFMFVFLLVWAEW